MNRDKKPALLIYHEWLPLLSVLPPEEFKTLILFWLNYDPDQGDPEGVSEVALAVHQSYRHTIERDHEKYFARLEASRAANAAKQNKRKKGRSPKPKEPSEPTTESDSPTGDRPVTDKTPNIELELELELEQNKIKQECISDISVQSLPTFDDAPRSSDSFDMSIFEKTLKAVYTNNHGAFIWDYKTTLDVFKAYFHQYQRAMNQPHPNLSQDNILRLIEKMPSCAAYDTGIEVDILSEDYEDLIKLYFDKSWDVECDYNINHFFSGGIRANLQYEYERHYRDLG